MESIGAVVTFDRRSSFEANHQIDYRDDWRTQLRGQLFLETHKYLLHRRAKNLSGVLRGAYSSSGFKADTYVCARNSTINSS